MQRTELARRLMKDTALATDAPPPTHGSAASGDSHRRCHGGTCQPTQSAQHYLPHLSVHIIMSASAGVPVSTAQSYQGRRRGARWDRRDRARDGARRGAGRELRGFGARPSTVASCLLLVAAVPPAPPPAPPHPPTISCCSCSARAPTHPSPPAPPSS